MRPERATRASASEGRRPKRSGGLENLEPKATSSPSARKDNSIRRLMAIVAVVLTAIVSAHCGGKLVSPADEVTTRLTNKDVEALKRRDAGAPDAR